MIIIKMTFLSLIIILTVVKMKKKFKNMSEKKLFKINAKSCPSLLSHRSLFPTLITL
jgi:hypothetical protein